MNNTVGVILAGGVGARMGYDIPKQLIPIAGKTSVEHVAETFESNKNIDSILIMAEASSLDKIKALLSPEKFSKIREFAVGGQTRSETSLKAISLVEGDQSKIIFHDAVRPLINNSIIDQCVKTLDEYGAVDVVIAATDTIVEVNEEEVITDIPPRNNLRRGQTPQAFRKETISAAYDNALQDPNFEVTDDCSVIFKYLPETKIKTIQGSESNIKLTYPIDIHLADKLFQLHQTNIDDTVDPQNIEDKVIVVFGGSKGIGAEVVEQAKQNGAHVVSCSRQETGTYVEDREDVKKALKDAYEKYGRIDHVVLSAGVLTVSELYELPDEKLREDVNVNLVAPLIVAQESYPYLKETDGSLLFYTSSSYTRGRANYTVYSATKAGVVNLTQALADEWGSEGIRVNCISPARTATPMRTEAFGSETPGTLLEAKNVAKKSLDVLSSDMTGHIIDVRLHD